MAKARTIIEEDGVEAVLMVARGNYSRFDEIWEGWTWRLVRNPLIFAVPVPGTNPQAYVVKSPDVAHYGGLPAAIEDFGDELALMGYMPIREAQEVMRRERES